MPRRLSLAPHLKHLLERQDGVLTATQAREAGFTRGSIDHSLRSQQWQTLLPGVYLLGPVALNRRQRVTAAFLWAGEGAAIDAESACIWHRIPVPNFTEDTVHVVVPYESKARSRDFVVVRRSNLIVFGDQTGVASYVDAATAVVAAARRLRSERAAVGMLSRPLQTGLVTLDDLEAAHIHAPPRNARLVRAALDQLGAGVRSSGESVAQRLLARSEILPQILWNRWLQLPDGGPLMCADGLIVEAGLVLEVNSKTYHAWALTFEDTEARQLRLTSAGLVVAPFTPRLAMVDGQRVLRDVEHAYLRHAGRGLPTGVEMVSEPRWRSAA